MTDSAKKAARELDAITFGKKQDNSTPWIRQAESIIQSAIDAERNREIDIICELQRQLAVAKAEAQPKEWRVEPCVGSISGQEWPGLSYVVQGKNSMGSLNTEVAKQIVDAHNATLSATPQQPQFYCNKCGYYGGTKEHERCDYFAQPRSATPPPQGQVARLSQLIDGIIKARYSHEDHFLAVVMNAIYAAAEPAPPSEDTERLDWLESKLIWQNLACFYDRHKNGTFREAIDAARGKKEQH